MARFATMDLQDLGMRIRRAQNSHVSHMGKLEVVHEVPFTDQEAQVLLSFQRLAYGLIPHFVQLSLFSVRVCFSALSISISKAL
jgi:hypothetical protein